MHTVFFLSNYLLKNIKSNEHENLTKFIFSSQQFLEIQFYIKEQSFSTNKED